MPKNTPSPEVETKEVSTPTFEIVGLQMSDDMPVVVDGIRVNLAKVTAEQAAWLYDRREQLPWLHWKE